MLSFPMFLLGRPLCEIEREPAVTPSVASRFEVTCFVCYYCKLFCLPEKVISFNISSFRTLCAKRPGWGVSLP
jgi:hypothetical protein